MNALAKWLPWRRAQPAPDPRAALAAAAAWIARAQDATGTGGVAAHYDVAKRRWAGAYPETTGYIIPTFLRYAEFSGGAEYRERALRMAAWESDIQLESGAVRAGTMDATAAVPTIFNTGQVLFGWLAAWQATGTMRFRDSLVRAADWLVAAQDGDGAWRKFASPYAKATVNTYNTRVAYALALTGKALAEDRYIDAAVRNVEWALQQMQPNGWLANNDLEHNARPLTHTIAYAARGILEVGLIASNPTLVDAAKRTAQAVAATQRRDGALPGRLDARWRASARWTCCTGNAQMAIVWQRLARQGGALELQQATDRAIAFTLSLQDAEASDPGIRGGIPGSWPRGGGYMTNRYPNWAAKFFMDAVTMQLEPERRHA